MNDQHTDTDDTTQDEPQLYDSPEEQDAQGSPTGHSPVTGIDANADAQRDAEKMGLYTEDTDGEHPQELNIAAEIEDAEKAHREN